MTLKQISEQARQLIIEGDLDEAANILVQFFDREWKNFGDLQQIQLYNQALSQLSQLNELKHQFFAGIISNEDADLKRNRIRAVLLDISNGLENANVSRPLSPQFIPMKSVAQLLGQQDRTMFFITWGVPLMIVAVVLTLAIKMWNSPPDTSQRMQQQLKYNQQHVTATNDEPISKPEAETAGMSGCFVRTRLLTGLLMQPEVMAQPYMHLPGHTEFSVLNVTKKNWAGSTQYFFKVKHDRYVGWVRQAELEFTSLVCLE